MNKPTEQSSHSHYIIGTMLLIAGLLIIMIFVLMKSQADDTSTSVTINNATPTIDSFTLATAARGGGGTISSDGTFNLVAGSTSTIYLYGDFTDNNGCREVTSTAGVASVWGAVYNSAIPGQSCGNGTQVATGCYGDEANQAGADSLSSSCVVSGCASDTDPSASYDCVFHVRHFASSSDSGDVTPDKWYAYLRLADTSNSSTSQTQNFEIPTLASLDITGSVNFGSITQGVSTTQAIVTLTNQGNKRNLDAYFSSTAFTCTAGSFTVGNFRYSSSSVDYLLKEPATASQRRIGISVNRQTTDATASTSTLYLQVLPPTVANNSNTTYKGTCTATATFDAL